MIEHFEGGTRSRDGRWEATIRPITRGSAGLLVTVWHDGKIVTTQAFCGGPEKERLAWAWHQLLTEGMHALPTIGSEATDTERGAAEAA